MKETVAHLILSPEGNCPTVAWLDEHLRAFIRIVRETRPEWNIAVMSFMREARERFQTDYALRLLACPAEGCTARLDLDAAWSCA